MRTARLSVAVATTLALLACQHQATRDAAAPAGATAATPRPDPLFGDGAEGGAKAADTDPYLWLEDVTGEKALAWVR